MNRSREASPEVHIGWTRSEAGVTPFAWEGVARVGDTIRFVLRVGRARHWDPKSWAYTVVQPRATGKPAHIGKGKDCDDAAAAKRDAESTVRFAVQERWATARRAEVVEARKAKRKREKSARKRQR